MKKNISFFILFLAMIVGGLTLVYCNSYKRGPTVSAKLYQYKNNSFITKITASYQGTSDYLVVLIPNMHNSFECQKQVYETLEPLVLRTRFIAREMVGFNADRLIGVYHWAFVGPFYKRTLSNSTTRTILGYMEKFVKLSKDKRIKTVNTWIKNNQYPEGSNVDWPIKAPYLIEAVYQDEVKCVGVGDAETNMRATIAVSRYEQGMISFKNFTSEVLNPRNKSFVKNIQKVTERDNNYERIISNHLVPFSVGYYHISGLRKLFEENKVSYVVIQNNACMPLKEKVK